MANGETVPVMQVVKDTCKVTINVSDLPQWEQNGFKPVKLEAGKPGGKGKKLEAGKPGDDPEFVSPEPEAGGEGNEKSE